MSESSAPSPGKISTPCTRCGSDGFRAIPASTAAGDNEWFHCPACGHLWPQQRAGSESTPRPHGGTIAAG